MQPFQHMVPWFFDPQPYKFIFLRNYLFFNYLVSLTWLVNRGNP